MPKQKWVELFQAAEGEDPATRKSGVSGELSQELAGCCFQDARLGRRLQQLVGQFGRKLGQSIPLACQDWTNTKAAYRFLANRRVHEGQILAGHFRATRDRAAAVCGRILVLHDTTEFTYYVSVGASAVSVSYDWDNEGRPIAQKFPDMATGLTTDDNGPRFTWGYDSMGRLSTMGQTEPWGGFASTLVSSTKYNAAGQMTQLVRPDGTENRTYL